MMHNDELDKRLHELSASTIPETAWLLTFADLLSLILTFFILMYAMARLEQAKWDPVYKSLTEKFSIVDISPTLQIEDDKGIGRKHTVEALDLDYLYTVLQEKIAKEVSLQGVLLHRADDRIIISLASDSLFASGSAELTPGAEKVLFLVGDILRQVDNRIDINGHTDPVPVQGNTFPSNWELSLARAVAVAEILKAFGDTYEVNAFGLADTRHEELAQELPADALKGLSRRVDIVVRTARAE